MIDDDDDVMMILAKTSSKFYIICTEKCQILNVERLSMLNPAKESGIRNPLFSANNCDTKIT